MATTTITVSNSQQLYAALAKSTGGETILLQGGNYGAFDLTQQSGFNYSFPSTVTIASADPNNPAVFSSADVRNASNLTFDGLTFDYTYKAGQPKWVQPFDFSGCTNLTIRNSVFDGDNASGTGDPASDGYATGHGLVIGGGSGLVVENNELFGFFKGMVIGGVDNAVVRGNELHSMRMDGMNFARVQNVLIDGNYVHDFRGAPNSGDHCDMIQFWTNGTTQPSTNITIRDNILDIGNGRAAQSIFMRNEEVDTGRASFAAMAYRNVLIENNTITNGHKWGICLGETIGATVRGNTVVHADGGNADGLDSSVEIPLINVSPASTGVTITGNVTSAVTGWQNQSGWTVRNNAFVQDQDANLAGYYGDVFVDSTLQPARDGSHHFVAVSGGMIDLLGAGSSRVHAATSGLQVMFGVDEVDTATRVFDASMSLLNGASLPPGTSYLWDFGDGTTASGKVVSHGYAGGGDYPVTLTVVLPNGAKTVEALSVGVDSPELVTMDSLGRFVAFDGGDPVALGTLAKTVTSDGVQLGGPGVSASVPREHVADVVGADDMTISFTLDADKKGSSGELFRLHGSFIVGVTASGELDVQIMRNGTTPVTLTTKGAGLNQKVDIDHDVVVNLDNGVLQVWVDGQLSGQTKASGVVGGFGYTNGLAFGNPWGKPNFNGDISFFELSVGAGDFPSNPQTQVIARSVMDPDSTVDTSLTATVAFADSLLATAEGTDALSDYLDSDARHSLHSGSVDRFYTLLESKLDAFAA